MDNGPLLYMAPPAELYPRGSDGIPSTPSATFVKKEHRSTDKRPKLRIPPPFSARPFRIERSESWTVAPASILMTVPENDPSRIVCADPLPASVSDFAIATRSV